MNKLFVICDAYLRAFIKYGEESPNLSARYWTEMSEITLAAHWNIGERCAAYRHAKRFVWWAMRAAR